MFWRKKRDPESKRIYYEFRPQPGITTDQLAVVVAWLMAYTFGKISLTEDAVNDSNFIKHFRRVD